MATYENSYTKQEDQLLWTLHEIRHALHTQRQHWTIDEINRRAFQTYAMWQQEYERQQQNPDVNETTP